MLGFVKPSATRPSRRYPGLPIRRVSRLPVWASVGLGIAGAAAALGATFAADGWVVVAVWAVLLGGAWWLAQVDGGGREPMRFAVVDVETTGLDAADDRVIEISVVHADGLRTVGEPQSWLVRPDDGSFGGEAIHHISEAQLTSAPVFADVANELAQALDGRVFVAHNAAFDWAFLTAEFARLDGVDSPESSVLCTLRLAASAELSPLRLADVCEQLGVDGPANAHRASDDAEACARLLAPLLDRLGVRTQAELIERLGSGAKRPQTGT